MQCSPFQAFRNTAAPFPPLRTKRRHSPTHGATQGEISSQHQLTKTNSLQPQKAPREKRLVLLFFSFNLLNPSDALGKKLARREQRAPVPSTHLACCSFILNKAMHQNLTKSKLTWIWLLSDHLSATVCNLLSS